MTRGLVRGDMDSCGCFKATTRRPRSSTSRSTSVSPVRRGRRARPSVAWPGLAVDDPAGALVAALLTLTVAGLVYLVMVRLPRVAPVDAEGAS